MAQLIFFDETHTYTVDGETVPSVSELTRFISREIYGELNQIVVDNAAVRGTAVHKATEILDKYGKAEITEDIAPYLKAYIAFRKEHKCEWEKIEYATCHPGKLYAGTLDRIGTVDGKLTVLDIKTTGTIDPQHRALYGAQLNLYRKMLPEKAIEKLYVLQVKKDGTYKLYDLPIDDAVADACITLHLATKKKTRKRKENTDG